MSKSCNTSKGFISCLLSLLFPFPKALGVSGSRIRHVRRLALHILSSPGPRLPADSMEMAELSLRRVYLMGAHFRPPCHFSFPSQGPWSLEHLYPTCPPRSLVYYEKNKAKALR